VRGAVDASGQRLDARDRLYLLDAKRVLFVAGQRDGTIPVGHTLAAHELLPGSRLALLDAGHFPHFTHPAQFADLVIEFLPTSDRPDSVAPLRGSA
jgi:pimeloyl-ACP methyl ester carboxylesterase